jgi:hypothetical protein
LESSVPRQRGSRVQVSRLERAQVKQVRRLF